MSPELTTLELRLRSPIEPLNATQTQLSPRERPECWSIQQIVEHLLLTYQLTSVTFEARLAKGTPTRARPSLGQRMGQFAMLKLGYFPYGRKAPETVHPAAPSILQSGREIAAVLRTDLERMDALIGRAELVFGRGTQAISHQILGPLTSQQWRKFHLIHGLHHLKQINRIRGERNV